VLALPRLSTREGFDTGSYARAHERAPREGRAGQAIPYFFIFRATVDWFTPSASAIRD
jgi:hypothetical protein